MATKKRRDVKWDDVAAASDRKAFEERFPPRKFREPLPCKLSDAERIASGIQVAALTAKIDRLKDEQKAAADKFKAEIELVRQECAGFLRELETGTRTREVEVVETFVHENNAVRVVRQDTGELVRERAMTADEKQPSLPFDDDAPEGEITDPEDVLGELEG